MSFVKHILVCLLSALLFFISWPPNSVPGTIFIALVPIIWLVFNFDTDKRKYAAWSLFATLFVSFFVLNFMLTSWVMKAHWGGGLFASVFNASLMSVVFSLVYKLRKQMGNKHAFMALPILWLAFEYLHLNWELTWPWLTLGNVFAEQPSWVQWYEYTGVLGGSLWVLLINSILYYTLTKVLAKKPFVKPILLALVIFIVPCGISKSITSNLSLPHGDEVHVVIVQPNYEPHFEKFNVPQDSQLLRVEGLLDSVWQTNPDLIVCRKLLLPIGSGNQELKMHR